MSRLLKTAEDLAWLLAHTQAFRGGQVTDLHVHKQRLFDEATNREITTGTVITAVIRYELMERAGDDLYPIVRVAKLTMSGVTDFSIFEQEGGDFAEIGGTHAEVCEGRLRFWFDPHGELYVICDEARIEEVARPAERGAVVAGTKEWTFQARGAEAPSVGWVLERLDRAGYPCAWRASRPSQSHPAVRWQGQLMLVTRQEEPPIAALHVQTFGPLADGGFGITLRAPDPRQDKTTQLLPVLAEILARSFPGTCLCGNQVMEPEEWLEAQGRGWIVRDSEWERTAD